MHTRTFVSMALMASLAAAACGSDSADDGPASAPSGVELERSSLERAEQPKQDDLPALAAGNQAFAFDVLHRLSAASEGENLVFSPYSISSALAMVYAGSLGATQTEMRSTLHFELAEPLLHESFNAADQALALRGAGKEGADGTPFRLNVNNSIWMQKGFPVERPYLDLLALHYGAGVFTADFARDPEGMRKAINRWVAERTEQLIPELFAPMSITTDTAFVLTNTVYFNASWATKFDPKATSPQAFTKLDGAKVEVQMMTEPDGISARYASGDGFESVALPYASPELSMILVLPAAGRYEAIEAAADRAFLARVLADQQPSQVLVRLPKLDYKSKTSLKETLQALGMNAAFANADFSRMTSEPVVIDDVIHEAVIKVIEGGTIAAAATGVTVRTVSAPLFDHQLTFDRPFFYAIVDEPTGQVLFMGRVLDPTAD